MPNWDPINNTGYGIVPYPNQNSQTPRIQNGMPGVPYGGYSQTPQYGYSQAPNPMPSQPAPMATTNMIWTQGISGAKAEPVNPGCQKWMMDSESMRFFIKSVDPSGIPLPLRRFRYVEETGPEDEGKSGAVDTSQFMTKDQFKQEFKSMLEEYLGPVKK